MEVKIKNVSVGEKNNPKILGVLNISPESFFTDSFSPTNQVIGRTEKLLRAGADIIDIGARSTALSAPPLSVSKEKERVVSALSELRDYDIPLSLDTMHVEVLEAALRFDISAVNDISGLTNEVYAKTAADSGLPVIAMASHKIPGDPTDISSTHLALREILDRADKYGIENLILDPGIGKWVENRSSEADWELCRKFSELKVYGCPLLCAVSRKSFIGECVNQPPQGRLFGSIAVLYALLEAGADLVRVHDVGESRDIISVFKKMKI
ncbi:MAG: dihydropteroate synthase [Methanocorpusculum sp.]|nr:dihydropteroate synthase [Methanocorpusculum sp.]